MSNKGGLEHQPGYVKTCPPNIRYPQANQTNHCMIMFVHYTKCIRLFDEAHASCAYFDRCVKSLCPNAWVERWNEQIENGTFPYDIPDKDWDQTAKQKKK